MFNKATYSVLFSKGREFTLNARDLFYVIKKINYINYNVLKVT